MRCGGGRNTTRSGVGWPIEATLLGTTSPSRAKHSNARHAKRVFLLGSCNSARTAVSNKEVAMRSGDNCLQRIIAQGQVEKRRDVPV